jgi:hypothetical protein
MIKFNKEKDLENIKEYLERLIRIFVGRKDLHRIKKAIFLINQQMRD